MRTITTAIGLLLAGCAAPASSAPPGDRLTILYDAFGPPGQVIVCGCSHPGIEKILDAASAIDPQIRLVAGGLHLAPAADDAIERLAAALDGKYKVARMAPGHCIGEPAFAAIRRVFGERYEFAGLGETVYLDTR
jgi:7,8-dihydropterin-6-yl-methyl-4-(beta-D-ribofuranosyl)aminobenzene 5'-phosphate synthase